MRKPYYIIIFLLGLVVVLSVVKAVAYNRLSTSGVFVGKAEEEISSYKTQNAILSEELLTFSSLTNISAKAEEAGFTNESSLLTLKKSAPLALGQ